MTARPPYHRRWCAMALGTAMAGLPACASLRSPQYPVPPAASTAAAAEPLPADSKTPESPAAGVPAEAPVLPACTCVEAKVKPKPKRPRPKPVPQEAPPQLPTAPTVAETPKGAVVNAQVRLINVPVMSILGKRVQGPNGEDLGRVVDVLADDSGRVRIAIIDFGGFLGVGARRIAVDWPLLRFNPDAKESSLLLSVSREKLQSAPEYKENPRPQTLMEPLATVPAAASAAAPTPASVSPDNKK